ncbi:MAG: acyltransferase [Acidimicrobiales bacterium]
MPATTLRAPVRAMNACARSAAPARRRSASSPAPASRPEAGPATVDRDPVVDLLRAASIVVVVTWHWVANLVVWGDDGPYAVNPIGEVPGGWLATWVLQVMPLFFVLGGFAAAGALARAGGSGPFVVRRLRALAGPAVVPLAGVAAVAVGLHLLTGGAAWVVPAALLLVMPLWFLAVYLVLVIAFPAMAAAHRRAGLLAVVPWAAVAVLLDLGRFCWGWSPWIGILAFVAVYGFAHQLGLSWARLVADRRRCWGLVAVGLAGLVVLTGPVGYPRSMVGIAGEPVSNMAPPTIPVLFLCLLQCGLAGLARPWLARRLAERRGLRRTSSWMNANAMAVYLWHVAGAAAAAGVLLVSGLPRPDRFTGTAWIERPLAVAVAAATTAGLLGLSGRVRRRRATLSACPPPSPSSTSTAR